MLADAILVVHFAIAAGIVAGFVLIPAGALVGWRWVRSRPLRAAHLGAMLFVAAETLAGLACPLTVWEDRLRGRAGDAPGFVERWLGALLYWDLPPWTFATAYLALAVVAIVLWRVVPPRRSLAGRP